MAEAPQDIPDVRPGIAEIYKPKVARLTKTLEDPATRLDVSSDSLRFPASDPEVCYSL